MVIRTAIEGCGCKCSAMVKSMPCDGLASNFFFFSLLFFFFGERYSLVGHFKLGRSRRGRGIEAALFRVVLLSSLQSILLGPAA